MEERRLIVALALSILLMTAWSHFFGPKGPLPRTSPAPVTPAASSSPSAPTPEGTPVPATLSSHPAAPPAAPTVAALAEGRVEALTSVATLAFTNRGASLLSWQLSRYPDARGRGEEMVRPERNGVRPLDLETGDPEVDARLREALFQPSAETITGPKGGEAELVFTWAGGGIEAEKTLRFLRGGELVEVKAGVKRDGRSLPVKLLFGPGLGTATKEEKGVTGYLAPQGIVLGGSGVERLPPAKLTEARAFSGVKWIERSSIKSMRAFGRYFRVQVVRVKPWQRNSWRINWAWICTVLTSRA